MAWAIPPTDLAAVNAAGRELAKRQFPMEGDDVLKTVNHWRSSHAFPLNTFQVGLRRRALSLDQAIDVAQRIKRLESIHAKLVRGQTSTMRLTQMQDIGGCRVVFGEIENVFKLVEKYKKSGSKFLHKLKNEKDYINHPKADGYRCYHLVYEFNGGHSRTKCYDGLKIEIQIRTRRQHAWATAVEAVGIFTGQALKSNQGDSDWRRFFALMASAIACMERTPCVPGTPDAKLDLMAEIELLERKLEVCDKLSAYRVTLDYVQKKLKKAKYYLVKLDFDAKKVSFNTYGAKQSQRANIAYTALERQVKDGQNVQIVLVSVDSLAALRRAYPNYFLDTGFFSDLIREVLKGNFPDPIPCEGEDSAD